MGNFDQRDFDRAKRLVHRFEAAIDNFNAYDSRPGSLWEGARYSIIESMVETARSYGRALLEFNAIACEIHSEKSEEICQESMSRLSNYMDIVDAVMDSGKLQLISGGDYDYKNRYRYACVFFSELQTAYLALKTKSFIPQKQVVKLK
jgi:hypothetical protein